MGARRPFFALADLEQNARRVAQGKPAGVISPIALEVVRRIDALFAIERNINGHSAEQRRAVRQASSAPLVADLEGWMGAMLRPPPQLTVSEWAERHRMLGSRASAEPGPWRTSRTPYLKDVMDALSAVHPARRVVFMMSCTRFLWTPICPRRDRNDDVQYEKDRSF